MISLLRIDYGWISLGREEIKVSLVYELLLILLILRHILNEPHPFDSLWSCHWSLNVLDLQFLVFIYGLSLCVVALCRGWNASKVSIVKFMDDFGLVVL